MSAPDEPESTHLDLIRHGESTPQTERIMGGMRGDRGLTPKGMAQAERLRDRLAATREIAADVVITSTMPRARQTAQIIARRSHTGSNAGTVPPVAGVSTTLTTPCTSLSRTASELTGERRWRDRAPVTIALLYHCPSTQTRPVAHDRSAS